YNTVPIFANLGRRSISNTFGRNVMGFYNSMKKEDPFVMLEEFKLLFLSYTITQKLPLIVMTKCLTREQAIFYAVFKI
ncbi:MAG: hypothetical protein WBZ36_15920, partial [Candidatus Nitrosopolaris sp.]